MEFGATLRLNRSVLTRMIVAGSAWGLTVSAGFLVIAFTRCGVPCPDDVAVVTAACVGTGIVTIGPFAILAAPR